jgi:hypothetical protein
MGFTSVPIHVTYHLLVNNSNGCVPFSFKPETLGFYSYKANSFTSLHLPRVAIWIFVRKDHEQRAGSGFHVVIGTGNSFWMSGISLPGNDAKAYEKRQSAATRSYLTQRVIS